MNEAGIDSMPVKGNMLLMDKSEVVRNAFERIVSVEETEYYLHSRQNPHLGYICKAWHPLKPVVHP